MRGDAPPRIPTAPPPSPPHSAAPLAAMLDALGTLFYLVPVSVPFKAVVEVPDYIAQAVPYFILLMLLEFLYGKWRKYELYTLRDTIMSVSLGLVQQLLGLFAKEISYGPYIIVYNMCEPFHSHLLPRLLDACYLEYAYFAFALFGVDHGYYWFHRLAHEWHLLWSAHAVHHSGERYNLATALRQGATQSFFSWIVYLPLAALGLPPVHFVRHSRLNTLYQFWIHTEVVQRMPVWFERFFNTPSHHRMHHMPPGNCNYAGVLIIWDRLYGTFEQESHRPLPPADITLGRAELAQQLRDGKIGYRRNVVFGLAQPQNTYDPVFANVQHFARLRTALALQSGLRGWDLTVAWLRKIFSTRVTHPLTVVTSTSERIPDVTYDRELRSLIARATGPGGLGEQEAAALSATLQLPPPLPSLPLVPGSPEAQRFTTRELTFLNGRQQREGQLSDASARTLLHHFVWTLVFAYALMLLHDKPVWADAPLTLAAQGAVAALCVVSLQWMQFY